MYIVIEKDLEKLTSEILTSVGKDVQIEAHTRAQKLKEEQKEAGSANASEVNLVSVILL